MFGLIIGIIVTLVFLGAMGFLIWWYIKKDEGTGVPVKASININFDSTKYEGHAILVETNSTPTYNPNNILIEGKPLDTKVDNKGNPIIPNNKTASINRSFITAYPEHSLSDYRQINFFICKPENMHPIVRNSMLGMALAIVYETTLKENMVIESIKNRQEQTTEVIRALNSGELFTDALDNIKYVMQDSIMRRLQQENIDVKKIDFGRTGDMPSKR